MLHYALTFMFLKYPFHFQLVDLIIEYLCATINFIIKYLSH